jgi:hypothetical protein
VTAGQLVPRLLRFGVNLLLAAVAIASCIALFEVGLRVAGYRALYEVYSKPSLFWQHDSLLGWSHEPGVSGEYVGPRPWPIEFRARVTINSLGLRGPELTARSDRELRVLFLGDSMVAGFEVEQAQTFVSLLQDELSRRLDRPVRTINAGVRGYGTDQYYLYYSERGRLLEPDAVVVFHSANDAADNRTLHETRRPFGKGVLVPDQSGQLRPVGFPVEPYPACEGVSLSEGFEVVRRGGLLFRALCQLQISLFDHSALFFLASVSIPWDAEFLRTLYQLGSPRQEPQEPATDGHVAQTQAIMLALASKIRGDGAAFLLTGGPDDIRRDFEPGALSAAGTIVRDLGDEWRDRQEELRWKHDSHFNLAGHRYVAGLLASPIEEALRSSRPKVVTTRR